MSQNEISILKRALKRERLARMEAEGILEKKSAELYDLTLELKASNVKLEELIDVKTSEIKGVFENIIDAYIVVDIEGSLLKMNDAAENLLGFNTTNFKGNLLEITHPNERKRTAKAFNKLFESGVLTDFEVKIITKDNVQKLVQINSSVIYKNGKPIAAQGIARDITDDRMKTELIQQQKNELGVIVDNSPLGIILVQHGLITKCNKAFQNLSGYTEEEIEKLDISKFSFSGDFEKSKDLLNSMYMGRIDKFTIENKYLKKDGSPIWAKTTCSAVRYKSGDVNYLVALVEDITKEHENNLMIQVINNIAKAIVGKVDMHEIAWEIVNEIIEYLGTNDCVIYLFNEENQNLEQVAAYGDKVFNNKILNEIFIPLGDGIVGSVAKSGISEIINNTRNYKRYIVDDIERLSEITVPIISDGNIIGVIDSESKKKNYFNSHHLITLENVANIVSMQLANAISLNQKTKAEQKNGQLLKALEESNFELKEYAHVVSHDLKSPLRSINALVNWLKEDNLEKLDDNSIKNIKLIETTLENMEQLISDILDYSSVSSDQLSEEIIDLNKVVLSIIADLQPSSSMSIEVLNKLPSVKGDKTRFLQLFQNLISNSIRHNDKLKGFIKIDYTDNNTYHKISIEDNGIGIEKKYFNKIFEIFQSIHITDESTGVGLSIVKKIINLYQGDIWLESEVGKGSTFHFTLKKC